MSKAPTVAYFTHSSFVDHDEPAHAENARRIRACWQELETSGLLPRLRQMEAAPASDEALRRVHTDEYLRQLATLAQQEPGRRFHLDADTYASANSPASARLAAGAVIGAVDASYQGEAERGLALVRPPGHHARPMAAMGFCLLGNIAIAARHALDACGLERVLIVDYDVHHGNGTQEMLYEEARTLFFSVHQAPFYPGSGMMREIGDGAGLGSTINAPLPAGHGDASYRALFERVLFPAARRYRPELVLVSAGFDAHWRDPLARMNLSLRGYDWLARALIALAEDCCAGRIVFALEGGYDTQVLGLGVRNLAQALLGDEACQDPFGAAPETSPPVEPFLQELCQIHKLPPS